MRLSVHDIYLNMGYQVKNAAFLIAGLSLLLSSCEKEMEETLSWQPQARDDGLEISSAREQGVDSAAIDLSVRIAERLDNFYSLLVMKNGYLIAEAYFNGRTMEYSSSTASVTKSITSALAGIAIREGYISGTEQRIMESFPEIDWESTDPRKSEITVEHILQMRSGYPWEEFDNYLDTLVSQPDWIPFLKRFPLMHEPGTQFGYSNLTAHMMAIIIARGAEQTLADFAAEYLFDEMGISVPYWPKDRNGNYYGSGDVRLTPRSLAKFGQLYLDEGVWKEEQLIPSAWIDSSLTVHSPSTYGREIMNNIATLQYGYLWWTGMSGSHRIWFAWGHGGQIIAVVRELNMVVVATATTPGLFDPEAWPKSKAVLDLVGGFIAKN